ncbi:MAG: hypothetical protein LBE37_14555 [Sphingobacterium sp.]|jgi:uncharacterized protein YwqG|nr:hypothetical protein [Sphingobacterium sp.]
MQQEYNIKNCEFLLGSLIDSTSLEARFGGGSFLPQNIDWPSNVEGRKLVLLFSIPMNFIGDVHSEELYLSVFTTYYEGYFLDEVIDNGEDESEVEKYSSTKVLIHKKGDSCRSEADIALKSFSLILGNNISEMDNINEGIWRIGGAPLYLQNAPKIVDDMIFVIQFYTGNLPSEYQDILYLSDAIGYLFIKKDLSGGYFFGQCT